MQCEIRETLSGYGILLQFGNRDSPKFAHACEIGKEKDIQDFRAEKRSAQASAHPLSQAQGGLFCVLTVFVCYWSSE